VQKPFRGKNVEGGNAELLLLHLEVDDTFSFIVEVPIEQ